MKKQKFGWVTFEAPVGSIVLLPEEVKEIKRFGINLMKALESAQKEIKNKKR